MTTASLFAVLTSSADTPLTAASYARAVPGAALSSTTSTPRAANSLALGKPGVSLTAPCVYSSTASLWASATAEVPFTQVPALFARPTISV